MQGPHPPAEPAARARKTETGAAACRGHSACLHCLLCGPGNGERGRLQALPVRAAGWGQQAERPMRSPRPVLRPCCSRAPTGPAACACALGAGVLSTVWRMWSGILCSRCAARAKPQPGRASHAQDVSASDVAALLGDIGAEQRVGRTESEGEGPVPWRRFRTPNRTSHSKRPPTECSSGLRPPGIPAASLVGSSD